MFIQFHFTFPNWIWSLKKNSILHYRHAILLFKIKSMYKECECSCSNNDVVFIRSNKNNRTRVTVRFPRRLHRKTFKINSNLKND